MANEEWKEHFTVIIAVLKKKTQEWKAIVTKEKID